MGKDSGDNMADIAWIRNAPEAALTAAHDRGQPVLLYWGAQWCPPCNRVKAEIFSHPDLAPLLPGLVPLYLDGDSDGAQRLAERFHLRSYPTLVLMRSDGRELTRLPCEVDGARFASLLALAMQAPCTVAASLDAALSGTRELDLAEWRLLAFYSWDTDEGRLLGERQAAPTLAALADACPDRDCARRLAWHACYLAAKGKLPLAADAALQLARDLGDAQFVRNHADIICNYAADLVRLLTAAQSEARAQLTHAWSSAVLSLETDPFVNLSDQLFALRVRVRMARLGQAVADIEDLVRARVTDALAQAADPALRLVVLNIGAGAMIDAGMATDAATLLSDEMRSTHSPYYFMHTLATLAKKRGDAGAAVDWYERAWRESQGAATRLQWGTTYLLALIELAPDSATRIEQCAQAMLADVATMRDAHCQRNRSQLVRIADKLPALASRSEVLASLLSVAQG